MSEITVSDIVYAHCLKHQERPTNEQMNSSAHNFHTPSFIKQANVATGGFGQYLEIQGSTV